MEIIVLALATWRLASLLSSEEGPLGMFTWIRHHIGKVQYDDHGRPFSKNWLGKGMICLWCCSMWFGAGLAVLYVVCYDSWWLSLPFALSATAIVIERWVNG